MNKGFGGKQPILRDGWFDNGAGRITQSINFFNDKNQWTPKGTQRILEKPRLWPAKRLNLCCPKPKCLNCQVAADCEICVKGHKCDTGKIP